MVGPISTSADVDALRLVGGLLQFARILDQEIRLARPEDGLNLAELSVLGIVGRGGVHAEFTSLPLANLHRVPECVSDDAAVFTEPLAAAVEILEQVHIAPSDRVLLVGAGRLGQLIAVFIEQRPHASVRVTGDDRLADPQRAALDEHRGDRTATAVEVRLDGHPLRVHVLRGS